MSASNQLFCRSDLRAGVETLEVKHVGLNEVLLHLVELVGLSESGMAVFLKQLHEVRDRPLRSFHNRFVIICI